MHNILVYQMPLLTTNRRFLNTYVKQRYLDITNSIFKLEITGAINRMSPVEIKKYVESSLGAVADEAYTFSEHFERFISTREKESTKDIYHQTLLKIELFSPGKLAFSDINIIWLKGFEQFLKGQGLSVNSINTGFVHQSE